MRRILLLLLLLVLLPYRAWCQFMVRSSPTFIGTATPLVLKVGQFDEYNVTLTANTPIKFDTPVITGTIFFRLNLCENQVGGFTPTFNAVRSDFSIVNNIGQTIQKTNGGYCETQWWTDRNNIRQIIDELVTPPVGGIPGVTFTNTPSGAGQCATSTSATTANWGSCGSGNLPTTPATGQLLFSSSGSPVWSAFTSGSDIRASTVTAGLVNLGYSVQTCSTTPCTVTSTVVLCNATAGPITLNLPAASGSGRPRFIKNLPGSTSACTVAANGTDTIDGAATLNFPNSTDAAEINDISSGTWTVIDTSYHITQTLPAHNFATGLTMSGTLVGARPNSTDLGDLPIPVTSGGTGHNAAGAATANAIGAAALGVNSDITQLTGLITPLTILEGGTGSTAPTQTANGGLNVSGSWPNQIFSLASPVTVANGGTGQTAPGAAAAHAIGAAASGANSDITSITGLTTPLSFAQGGRQCGAPTTFAGRDQSPTTGELCFFTDTTGCQAGTAITVGNGSIGCGVMWNGTNWLPAMGAVSAAQGGLTTAGNGLTASGSTVSLNAPVSVANGGTGNNTLPTAGQLAIGQPNNIYTPTTMNGDGTITSAGALTVTKTNGVAFATSATTNTTNASNITSGTLPAAQLPNPTASTLGGIESLAAVSHKWINSISTSGVPSATQPASTDLSDLPIPISSGGNGSTTPGIVGGTGILTSGAWPNQTVLLNTPVLPANGGTGSTTVPTSAQIPIGNSGGTAYVPQSITGDVSLTNAGVTSVTSTHLAAALPVAQGGTGTTTAPTSAQILIGNGGGTAYVPQTVSGDVTTTNAGVTTVAVTHLTNPLPLAQGGTQCAGATTVGSLPGSPVQGERCTVTDDTQCTAGAAAVGGGSTKCSVTWCGSSWLPGDCVVSSAAGGVTAVNATAPIASSGGTTPTISITNPLPVANGGTNATVAGATAANNIGALAIASNLSDVANATTARTNIVAAKSGANSDITSLTGLTTPLSIAQGGNGTATPGLTAGAGITLGSTWPTQSIALTTPVSVANGGTGTASPGLTAGNGLSVSGSFPTQQFVLSTPVTVANGGTQCGPPTVVASLPGSPTQGEICNVTDATACNQGSAVVGGGAIKCQVTWNGTSWLPGGGANSNGVTSVTASAPISSSGGTTPNITLSGIVPVANGGTNASAAGPTAAHNIGAAALGANSDITSITGLTTPLAVAQGGNGTATPSLQAGANITISGSWPNQTITGSAGGSSLPINQLPNQTGNYNAQGFQINNLGAPSVTGDALSQGNAISGTSGSFSFFVTAPYFATNGTHPAQLGLLRDFNSNNTVMARNLANTADINEIGTSNNAVVVGDAANASTITLSNPLTSPLATGSGGTGIASPTAHDVPITEGASAFNLIALATDQVLIGSTGADPGAFTIPNCGDATHALSYTTSGHFACQALASGGGGATPGFVQSPTVTAGNPSTVTLLVSCASAGCTDDNRIGNPNGNPLQITLPTAANITDGQYITVSVADGATPPSAINWVASAGFTFKSGVIGDTDASPGSAAACGTPPSPGGMYYVWKATKNSSVEKLLECGPDPSLTAWPVTLGGTGHTSASAATANAIGAAELGANSSITSLTGLTTPLSAAQGGSGVASPTQFGLLYGNGTGAFGNVVLANDQLLLGHTSAAPTASTGSLICGDSTHALAYSHAAGFFCQAITATASAGGTAGSMQWNNAGALAGLSGTGIPVLQGSGTPIILAGNTLAAHNFANSINASGVIAGAQPICGDLSNAAASCSIDATNASNISSGTLLSARLPNPTSSTLGGVQSAAAQPHQWINSISTAGVPSLSQPAFSDISGQFVTSQFPASGVAGTNCTNCNLTYDSTGRITVAANGTGGGGGTTAGFINSPAFASPVILVAQCTSPGCTDDNRVANGSNAGTLTLQLPASTGLADGEYLKVTVNDTGTAPSSIVWTSGTGITFKSALTGDTDGTPGSVTACGSPPATGTSQYLWWINYVTPGVNTSAIARLVGCGPDPSGATISPALGGLIGATFGAAFDFVGTPGANQLQGLTEVYTMNIPANYAGSACTCGTAPGSNQSYPIACNGVAKGTLTVNSSCTATVNASNATWPTQAAYQCTSGQALTLMAPASPSGADILCTIAFQR